jgi:tetratricopeptide (TPR) repeat protein
VALIQGLAGLGKTALAAEAIHLLHDSFDYVLAFQAKPNALQFDDFCRRMDQRLTLESPTYRNRCGSNAFNHIYLSHDARLFPTPDSRYDRMRDNLMEALRAEAVLLVIDNFETNLEKVESKAGSACYACADPAWDALLDLLGQELHATRSRLLLTSRHRPEVLAGDASTLWIPLGPLPMAEAALFTRSHPNLRKLLFGENESDKELIHQLLKVSRGHPLILDRFARLAAEPSQMKSALDRVRAEGWRQLPDLFDRRDMNDTEREAERKYLEDVAIGSVDLLIERLTPDARRLLQVVTVANEPVSERFIDGVWQGKSVMDEQLDEIAQMAELMEQLPDDAPQKQMLEKILATDQGKKVLELVRNRTLQTEMPPIGPLLTELCGSGLLTKESVTEGETLYAFHELVRERVAEWRKTHKADAEPRTEDEIRIAYGERYKNLFKDLYHKNRNAAGEAGRRALVYFVTAQAFERLGSFASWMVTGINDPELLQSVITELEGAIDQAPPGESRWSLRTYVADALYRSGQPDRALPFYSEAAEEAEAAKDWSDVAWITGNWANAVGDVGDLEKSKQLHLRSADIERRAGNPEVNAVSSELEALRIDVMQGEVERALPEIESRLEQVRGWWQKSQAGETVTEAPDKISLGRVIIGGLDIARGANQILKHWEECLKLLKETELIQQALGENKLELTKTRFNQSWPLLRLNRLDEAQRLLEECLGVFRSVGAVTNEASCLSALADLWDERNEITEAIALERQALAVRNTLPDPSDRSISHNNLSNYYDRSGQHEEATQHQLAAGAYRLVIRRQDHLSTWFRNLTIDTNRALNSGTRYTLPRLKTLLANEAFAALRQFLDSRNVDIAFLQAEIDKIVEAAHEVGQNTERPQQPQTEGTKQ